MTKKKQIKKPSASNQVKKVVEMTPEEKKRDGDQMEFRRRVPEFKKNEDGALEFDFKNSLTTKHENLLIRDTFGVKSSRSAMVIVQQLANFSSRADGVPNVLKINEAMSMVAEFEPQDSAEIMLVTQMFAVQEMMMDCSMRTGLKDQTFEGRQINLNGAIKLTRAFTGLVDTLNKHRGKGQQKMTVEHVTVNEGGQAVVGNINAGDSPQVFQQQGGNKNNG
jgi:hypothetical protein